MRNFHFAGRSTVHAQNAMVATSHPAAALVAVDVMRAGGTAADAAVAAAGLLAVIEPQSTGIGGDCFALIQPKGEGKIVAYNGSGRAPMAGQCRMVSGAQDQLGAADLGARRQHTRRHRCLGDDPARSRQDGARHLLQPAIKAAEEGYIVAPRIAFDWKNGFEKLKNGTNTARYLLPHGKPAAVGDAIHQPELGKTLRAHRQERPRRVLYRRDRRRHGRQPARHRRSAYAGRFRSPTRPRRRSPIGTIYKGHDVWQCPPNGPGITMLVMLNILSRFDLTKDDPR